MDFILDGRQMDVSGILYGVQDGPLELIVTTTAGNEVVSCNSSGGIGACDGNLTGDPMIGGSTLVANNRKVVAIGPIQLMRY